MTGKILTIIQQYQNEWVLDFKNMYVDTMTDKYTVIIADETKKMPERSKSQEPKRHQNVKKKKSKGR